MEREAARIAALLDRRTAALATRPGRGAASAQPEARQSLIIWGVGESPFATDVGSVAAVIPFAGCARVPTREAACIGVIGRAARFYSVICMRRLLAMPASEERPRHLLLLRGNAPYLALAVDRVLGRFDLATGGGALSFEGRLVAPFDPAELRTRLGLSSLAALALESMSP